MRDREPTRGAVEARRASAPAGRRGARDRLGFDARLKFNHARVAGARDEKACTPRRAGFRVSQTRRRVTNRRISPLTYIPVEHHQRHPEDLISSSRRVMGDNITSPSPPTPFTPARAPRDPGSPPPSIPMAGALASLAASPRAPLRRAPPARVRASSARASGASPPLGIGRRFRRVGSSRALVAPAGSRRAPSPSPAPPPPPPPATSPAPPPPPPPRRWTFAS